MRIPKLLFFLLYCFSAYLYAEDQVIKTEAGALKSSIGSTLISGKGTGLLGNGSSLSGSASGLNATESDLGTAIHLAADVLFDFDKAELKPEAAPILEKVVAMIQQKQPKQIQIHGYTDSKGSDEYNQTLSHQRAQAVADWFEGHGIAQKLLATGGFGETNPIAPNENLDGSDNPEGRKQNRRVDILLKKKFSPITPLKSGLGK
jgi:outer membrane protein OmpA-like peptidoglycan-associated protein